MPSRETELYKDKIEVSLDGRQIFYLFFGGAVIVGLVFVLGVMIGRRVEARGHLDRAETQTLSDPLAALDRLERSDNLSFHGALTGSSAPTDVEKAIGELDKRRQPDKPDKRAEPPVVDAKPVAASKPDKSDDKPEKLDTDKPRADRAERTEKPDKHDGDKKPKKHDDGGASELKQDRSDAKRPDRADKPVTRPDARADTETKPETRDRTDGKPTAKPDSDAKVRFTLQLSSFQDKAEAEAFLGTVKSAGFQPYLTEADVNGKGTFYRVRLGSYRSLDAANDAKAEYEKTARKTAQVMRL